MSGNSISFTNRNNANQEFIGKCLWGQPEESIAAGQKITVSLFATVVKLDKERVGTFTATINAYLDNPDIKYKIESGSAIDCKLYRVYCLSLFL